MVELLEESGSEIGRNGQGEEVVGAEVGGGLGTSGQDAEEGLLTASGKKGFDGHRELAVSCLIIWHLINRSDLIFKFNVLGGDL